jgi:hypothetical protein
MNYRTDFFYDINFWKTCDSTLMVIPLHLYMHCRKVVLTKKKKLNFGTDGATSSGSQSKLTYFMYFPCPPLEARLQCFVFYLHVAFEPLISERNYPA